MVRGCPRCGPKGAIVCESFRAEDKWFVEFSCIMCSRLWTPNTVREVIVNRPSLEEAKRIARLIHQMMQRELQGVPTSALTTL